MTVFVRIRPFNNRETSRNAQCIVKVVDNKVVLSRPTTNNPSSTNNTNGTTAVISPTKSIGNDAASVTSNTSTPQLGLVRSTSLSRGSPVPSERGDRDRGDSENPDKSFAYDSVFWSFSEKNDGHPQWASQEIVYDNVGRDLLDHAFNGYNVCLFAYGQTGSGKSYTMMGYREQKGIIPRSCEELFARINALTVENVECEVTVSYIEIYNERVRDLLNPSNKGNLRVREHPQLGPYVEDLTKLVVTTYENIETFIDLGNKSRTVAATNMNETSSRSHAVFTINLTQTRTEADPRNPSGDLIKTQRSSRISLVDLAGSERADATGATGVRLKEGANINKSLTTLGKVISALADAGGIVSGGGGSEKGAGSGQGSPASLTGSLARKGSSRKLKGDGPTVFIPYRDSVLTWLLKDSLGGNSKTVMMAAISPADINYDETLSTLRYAERAKRIVNKAVVNEDETGKIVRLLRDEVERLRLRLANYEPEVLEEKLAIDTDGGVVTTSSLSMSGSVVKTVGGGGVSVTSTMTTVARSSSVSSGSFTDASTVDVGNLKEQLSASEKLIAEMTESYSEKLRKTEEVARQREKALEELGITLTNSGAPTSPTEGITVGVLAPKTVPHLLNLNEDPTLSECLLYRLPVGLHRVGSSAQASIWLTGTNILDEHACFECVTSDSNDGKQLKEKDKDKNDIVSRHTVILHPAPGSITLVNGKLIVGSKKLKSGCRIIFGENHVFRFSNPTEPRRQAGDRHSTGGNLGIQLSNRKSFAAISEAGYLDVPSPSSSPTSLTSDNSLNSSAIDWMFAKREINRRSLMLGPGGIPLPMDQHQDLAGNNVGVGVGVAENSILSPTGSQVFAMNGGAYYAGSVSGESIGSSALETRSFLLKEVEVRMRAAQEREMERLVEENVAVSREIADMEAQLRGERGRLKALLDEKMALGNGETSSESIADGAGNEGRAGDGAPEAEFEKVRALEEDLAQEKERMRRILELQKLSYESKLRRISARSGVKNVVARDVLMTERQKNLARSVVEKWRNRNYVRLAEEILANAVFLKEANVIAKELNKNVLYQFTILEDMFHLQPNSFWESASSSEPPGSNAGTPVLPRRSSATANIPEGKPFLGVVVYDGLHNAIYKWPIAALIARLTRMRAQYNILDLAGTFYAQRGAAVSDSTFYEADDPVTVKRGPGRPVSRRRPWYSLMGVAMISVRGLAAGMSREIQAPVMDYDTGAIKGILRVVISPISSEPPWEDEYDEDEVVDGASPVLGRGSRNRVGIDQGNLKDDNYLIDGGKIVFEVSILEIVGISESEFTQVHCQFRSSQFGAILTSDGETGDPKLEELDDSSRFGESWEGTSVGTARSVLEVVTGRASSEQVFGKSKSTDKSDRIFSTDPCCDFGDGPARWEFSQTLSVTVTPQVRNVIEKGLVRFEIFGRHVVPVSKFIKDVLNGESKSNLAAIQQPDLAKEAQQNRWRSLVSLDMASQNHMILSQLEISELSHVTGDFKSVPVQSQVRSFTAAKDEKVPTDCFLLRQGYQRRLTIRLSHTSGKDGFPWRRISYLRVGKVRRINNKTNLPVDDEDDGAPYANTFIDLAVPAINETSSPNDMDDNLQDGQTENVAISSRDGRSWITLEVPWDSSLHNCIHLNKATKRGQRLEVTIAWAVEVDAIGGSSLTEDGKDEEPASSTLRSRPIADPSRWFLFSAPVHFEAKVGIIMNDRDFKARASAKFMEFMATSGIPLAN
ncbi:kinesin-like protein Klp8, partial [Blyttiomyces sp. JEL0837]